MTRADIIIGTRKVLYSLDERYPTIGLIWLDGGYANSVDASLIDWADQELGVKLEVVKATTTSKASNCCRARGWSSARSAG